MRVLHVARLFHPHVGGTENFIASLAAAVDSHAVSSKVLTSERSAKGGGPAPQVPVVAIPVVGPNRFPKPRGGWRRILRAFADADVVHLHDLRFLFETAQLLARRKRIPLVLSTHGFIFHQKTLAVTKRVLWRGYYAPALRRLDRVIAVSIRDEELCRRSGIEANLITIPNPVEVEPFLNLEPAGSRAAGRLLYFGRLSTEKGLERLGGVLAVGDPGWTLTVIGGADARYARQARNTLAPFGARIRFEGYTSREQLLAELAGCACVVLPSRTEAFGMTLVEAMAAGSPVVASDIPAYREIVSGTDVRLVDFDDSVAAAAAIRSTLASYSPDAARSRAQAFSWDHRAGEFARVYEEVFARRRPSGSNHEIP